MDSENSQTAMFNMQSALRPNPVLNSPELSNRTSTTASTSQHKRNKSNLSNKGEKSPLLR